MSVDELTQIMERDEPGRPRRALVAFLTLGLIGAVIAVILVTQGDKRALAELRIRDDRVSVKPTEAEFEPGVEGQALLVGDTVRTSSEGQAQIDYFEGSETRLDSDTTLVIGALLNESGTRSVSIDQTNGRLWHRVERLTSSEDRYEVRTPNAVASVRGTTFATIGLFAPNWFFMGFDGETIVQTDEGEQF
ncbi:MAG: FecR domain-containing protein, partial [Actinomycetota bacterium]